MKNQKQVAFNPLFLCRASLRGKCCQSTFVAMGRVLLWQTGLAHRTQSRVLQAKLLALLSWFGHHSFEAHRCFDNGEL
jgi:hypothetical protein